MTLRPTGHRSHSTLDSRLLMSGMTGEGAGMTGGAFLLNMNQRVIFRRMDISFWSMDMLNIHVFGYKSL